MLISDFTFLSGLKFLAKICADLGLKEAQEYATKLKKAEKAKELREQVSTGIYKTEWMNYKL